MSRKSLGQLTLDIVARTGGFVQGMDQAERSSAKWRKQVDRDLKTIRGGIDKTLKAGAAAVAAATAATIALTKKGMDAVNSQAALAQSLDTTYDSITALQLAAGDTGLDGLEGSLTRLNRRLGAAEVGSGAAASAVKALQLDLEALSQMNVDERVATIADAIRDSGVSMQRAARFAQDLGFEQQQAAEFFMQGGDAIRAYRGEVDQLGLSLSAMEVAQVQEAINAMGIFGDLTTAVSQRLAVEFSPILRQVAQDLEDAAKETGGFSDEIAELVDTTVTAVAFVASSVDATGRVFSTLGKTAAIIFLEMRLKSYELGDSFYNGPIEAVNELIQLLNIVPGIDITPRALSGIGQQIKDEIAIIEGAIREGQRDVQDGLLAPLAGERLLKYFEDAKAAAEEAAKAGRKLRQEAGGDAPGDKPQGGASVDQIAKEITALERAAATWGMAADEVKLYDLTVQGATDSQLMQARALQETIAGFEEAKANQEAYLSLVQDLRTDEEKLTDQLYERLSVLDKISDATDQDYSRAVAGAFGDAPSYGGLAPEVGGPLGELDKLDDAQEKLQEWYDTQLEMLEEFRSERADLTSEWDEQEASLHQEHQDRLAEIERARQMVQLAAGEEFFGSLAGVTKAFFGEQSGLYRAAFALEQSYAVAKALLAAPEAYTSAYKAVVGIPYVGPYLAPAAGAAAAGAMVAQAAIAGSVSLGQAHEGLDEVPETGPYTLLKGERVTTAETSAKLDATLDRLSNGERAGSGTIVNVNNAPPGTRVEESTSPTGEQMIDIWVADFMADGRTAGAVQGKFGLSPQGR